LEDFCPADRLARPAFLDGVYERQILEDFHEQVVEQVSPFLEEFQDGLLE
jgi:hypothetical protein